MLLSQRALVAKPSLMLLDEPLNNPEMPIFEEEMRFEIKELQKNSVLLFCTRNT